MLKIKGIGGGYSTFISKTLLLWRLCQRILCLSWCSFCWRETLHKQQPWVSCGCHGWHGEMGLKALWSAWVARFLCVTLWHITRGVQSCSTVNSLSYLHWDTSERGVENQGRTPRAFITEWTPIFPETLSCFGANAAESSVKQREKLGRKCGNS